MFRHTGFRESWTADAAAEVAAGKGRPRASLNVSGAKLHLGLMSNRFHEAREIEGGCEFGLGPQGYLRVQDSRQAILPDRLTANGPGLAVTVVLDRPCAMKAFRRENGRLWVPFDLRVPRGTSLHYQPALTRRERDAGERRPPHIEGSLAVYGPADGGTGCADVGKLGHFHRRRAFDHKGRWTWEDWVIEKGRLWGTTPLDWLQSSERQWPITLDSYFGYYDPVGASEFDISNAYIYAISGSPVSSGTCTQLEAYRPYTSGWGKTMGLYAWSDGNPANLLQDTAEESETGVGWHFLPLDAPQAVVASTTYGLAITPSIPDLTFRYDSVTNAGRYGSYNYVAGVHPASFPTPTTDNKQFSFRANYTPAGGSVVPQIMASLRHRWG